MTRFILRLTLTVLFVAGPLVGVAAAEERWALVLGVSAYEDDRIPDLKNTVNDARTMSAALNQMGFKVYYVENGTRAEVDAAVEQIAVEQAESETGLFFFSGHGLQVGGENYALPADIQPDGSDFLKEQGISIGALVRRLGEVGAKSLVVILDSCRNSPFDGQGAIGTGLALVDAPENTIIAYSTAPGAVAYDGTGANSPYTSALAAVLDGPRQDIRDVLRLVRAKVRQATGGAQTPWYVDNSRTEIIVQPRPVADLPADLVTLEDGSISLATTAWRTIADSSDPRDFETFVDLFPNTDLANVAKRQITILAADETPGFPLMDLGLPEQNPEVPGSLNGIMTQCDVLATGVADPLALADPVPHDLVNTRAALRACYAALGEDPGNPRLLGLLSRVLSIERRFDEALYYGLQAAERGNAYAYGEVARIYRLGLAGPADAAAAAEAIRAGALLGSPAMRLTLGVYYREGWGLPQSHTEARRWMRVAANTGLAAATTALGDMYRRGQGGPVDHGNAVALYRRAAAYDHTDALNNIGMAYMRGQGVPENTDRGITWLSQASEKGNPYAAYHLGRAFRDGWGVERDLSQAAAFFRLSAQRNFLGAYIALGDVLASDRDGNQPDFPEALANLIIAREAGTLVDTRKSLEEAAEASAKIDDLVARISAEDRAAGEALAAEWIEQYGLLDFNLVNE